MTYRSQLTEGEDTVDPDDWAGRLPAARGTAPHLRIGRRRWWNLLWLLPLGLALLLAAIAA
ncbi:MAG TPA: hypothetical protein VG712_04710, partial [Gemmatimonadales bacterium]|nr:hypothetical protein [Gemmatimonadales bacterium]